MTNTDTDTTKSYFNEQEKQEKDKANAQLRKGFYNGEKYHKLQKSTRILMIMYYITVVVFGIWFIARGAYSGMNKGLIAINSFVLLTMPYIFYYYLVDWVLFIFNYLTTFVTSMSVSNLVAMVMTVLIGIFMLTTVFTTPVIATLTPVIITFSGVLIVLGILLRGSFMA